MVNLTQSETKTNQQEDNESAEKDTRQENIY